jgi:TonB family protein
MCCSHTWTGYLSGKSTFQPGIWRAFLSLGIFRSSKGVLMRSTCSKVLVLGAVALFLAASADLAQQSTNFSTEEGKRKVKTKVTPVYPELANRMRIVGKVKLDVTIAPDGRVRNVKLIGGNPVLAQAAQDALKEWKFYPGPEETTQVVEFNFHGPN